MAAPDRLLSSAQYILEGDTARLRPNSESVQGKFGQNINWLLDNVKYRLSFNLDGYFRSTSITNAIGGVVRLDQDYDVIYYALSLDFVGTSGETEVNVEVRDDTNAVVNNLFGGGANRLSISGNGVNNGAVIGRDVLNSTTFSESTTGLTVNLGVLNLTTLNVGYKLRCFLNNSAVSVRTMRFDLWLGGN